ncbi:PREDICTED: ly6/PLAUR domain-containing protein 8 [Capra hircus]|uniref:ly6/PLAUR domain-containing protein 8 n=1 Tax=Capra hircus TaxID=9925 RepID=UPI0006B11098|nr:PREDICTED: ly6/PLAUR domain-containing protein 8 [Capra hircus]
MSSTMKGFLFAGIIVVLTVAAVESQNPLSCVQCNSLKEVCDAKNATECPSSANSCTSFSTNFYHEGNSTRYENHACSEENCNETTVEPFTVYVSETEIFHFESQCCLGKACNQTSNTTAPPQQEMPRNIQCPACYGNNETSCNETQKCYGERCVSIIAEFINETTMLVLKGCSSVNISTCEFLGAANRTFRGVTFRKFECAENSSITTTLTPATTAGTGSQAAFTPLALASILLLRLLL